MSGQRPREILGEVRAPATSSSSSSSSSSARPRDAARGEKNPEDRARRKAKAKAKRKALDRLSRSTVSVGGKASKQPRAILRDLPVNKHAAVTSSSSSSTAAREILRPKVRKKTKQPHHEPKPSTSSSSSTSSTRFGDSSSKSSLAPVAESAAPRTLDPAAAPKLEASRRSKPTDNVPSHDAALLRAKPTQPRPSSSSSSSSASASARRPESALGSSSSLKAKSKLPAASQQSSSSRYFATRKVGPRSRTVLRSPRVPRGVDDIDRFHGNDPQYAPEYAKDVFAFLNKLQDKHPLRHDFMRGVQGGAHGITPQKRAILIDWLVDITEELLLCSETLYLSIAYLDRYLARKHLTHDRLQLLGITCLWIAAKFEEITRLSPRALLNLTDDAYRPDELRSMEGDVVAELGFSFMQATSKVFLRRFQRAARVTQQEKLLGNYLLELSLGSYELAGYKPALTAAAVVFVARVTLFASDSRAVVHEPSYDPRLHENEDLWHEQLRFYCGFSLEQMAAVVRKLHELHTQANRSNLRAVFNKYSLQVFCKVATTVPPYSGNCMPQVTNNTVLLQTYVSDSSSSSSSPSQLGTRAAAVAAMDSRRRVSDPRHRRRQPLAEVKAPRSARR